MEFCENQGLKVPQKARNKSEDLPDKTCSGAFGRQAMGWVFTADVRSIFLPFSAS